MAMNEAIGTSQSVRFRKVLPDTGKSSMRHTYFTLKRMLFEYGRFFAVGMHHAKKRIETVDLHEITEIELVQYRQPKMSKEVERAWGAFESQV